MENKDSTPNMARLTIFILIWFSICTLLIFYLSSVNKAAFDPKLKLSQALMSLEFEQELQALLASIWASSNENANGQIFHITQGDCYCEWLAGAHKNNIDTWASQQNVDVVSVNLSDYPMLKSYIPSTPTIMALNASHELIYLGPYSRGSGCFSASGQVDEYLEMGLQIKGNAPILNNAVIETDASGCYCAT